jgi:3-phenylpropionate/trans-cinnamate dioxygenase ferredoxin subunit
LAYHWIKIFDSKDEVENHIQLHTFIPFQLKGEKINVIKTDKGLFAFNDKCPHNGASLSKGFCTKNNEVVCPLHRYSFDLANGRATSGGAFALKTYPIEIKDNGVFVGIKASWWEL